MSKLSKTSAELTLSVIVAELAEVAGAWSRMMRNLDAAQPGFPASCPGAAPASGRSGQPDGLLPVERMATQPDDARRNRERVLALIEELGVRAHELYSLGRTWGFDRQQGRLDIEENDTWCDSCLRLHRCEPRFRGRLCRWCYSFVAAENRHPSLELLDAHHRGVRITAKMITDDHPARRVKAGRSSKSHRAASRRSSSPGTAHDCAPVTRGA